MLEPVLHFHDYCIPNLACLLKDVQRRQIINMDETQCCFDLPDSRTVSKKGNKSVPIATSGYEKLRFTTVFAVNADGGKLNSMLNFKNLKDLPKLKIGLWKILWLSFSLDHKKATQCSISSNPKCIIYLVCLSESVNTVYFN